MLFKSSLFKVILIINLSCIRTELSPSRVKRMAIIDTPLSRMCGNFHSNNLGINIEILLLRLKEKFQIKNFFLDEEEM